MCGYVYGVGYAVKGHGDNAEPGGRELVKTYRFKKAEGDNA